MTARTRALLIVGMHRSGTSALAGSLDALGLDLGTNLMPAKAGENERGFWEHADVVATHERLLTHLGYAWDDLRPLPEGWWRDESVLPYKEELRHIIRRDFGDAPLWGLKDPRLCRLLPLWRQLLDELGIDAGFIHVWRHPEEVAGSIARRNGRSLAYCRLLWASHVAEAVLGTQDAPCGFLTYEGLLHEPEAALRQLAVQLGLNWPDTTPQAFERVREFLSSELRHHRKRDSVPASDWASCYYERLAEAERQGETVEAAGFVAEARHFARFHELFMPWLSLSPSLDAALAERGEALVAAQGLGRELDVAVGRLDALARERLATMEALDLRLREAEGAKAEAELLAEARLRELAEADGRLGVLSAAKAEAERLAEARLRELAEVDGRLGVLSAAKAEAERLAEARLRELAEADGRLGVLSAAKAEAERLAGERLDALLATDSALAETQHLCASLRGELDAYVQAFERAERVAAERLELNHELQGRCEAGEAVLREYHESRLIRSAIGLKKSLSFKK